MLKVLVIGNSHGNDATKLLYEVFKAERDAGNTNQKVVIGSLYYSGCTISQHRNFMQNNKAVYTYYKNGDYDGACEDGDWQKYPKSTAADALTDEQWDFIVMQQSNRRSGLDEYYIASYFKQIITYVKNQLDPDNQPEFLWNMVWTNPDQKEYFDPNNPLAIQGVGEEGYSSADRMLANHIAAFPGDTETGYDQSRMYTEIVRCTQTYIAGDSDITFLGEDYYSDVIPSGTIVEYVQDVFEYTQAITYRDYTHLSDYSRLMVAYLWYAKLTNLTKIDAVNVDAIPEVLQNRESTYPGDGLISSEMKSNIIEAVNWTLEHPYELPSTEKE